MAAEGIWEHPDWARLKGDNDDDDDENAGIADTDIDQVNDWVVKLTFNRVGVIKPLDGNGFFLDIPGIKDRHIILTAAHNLIKDGNRSLNLKAIYNNPYEVDPTDPSKVVYTYPGNSPFVEVSIENTSPHTFICERYVAGSTEPSADYGVICIPRAIPGQGPRGFGFSLNLAFKKVFKGTVHVSGFKEPKDEPGSAPPKKTLRPTTSSTSKMVYHKNHVEYWAETEPGISGSPVWVEYNKTIAAIGIHNQGADAKNKSKQGRCGALLNVDLLTQVFNWISPTLIRTGVQIQARQPPPPKKKRGAPAAAPAPNPFERGLFVSFKNVSDFGRVRLGSGTRFDYMPVQVDAKGIASYGFYAPSVKKWLKFDLGAKKFQNLKLTEKWSSRGCPILQLQDSDVTTWVELGVNTGEVDGNNSPIRMRLRMQGAYIKLYDENRETAEISLVQHPNSEQASEFNRFILAQ